MTLSGYTYRCSAGETFDSVALAIYGDEKYAADLLSANAGKADKLTFSGGEVLEVPTVEIFTDRTTGQQIGRAPWKE